MKITLCLLGVLIYSAAFTQTQICPENINFNSGSLTHWSAYTGNNRNGNGPGAIQQVYDSTQSGSAGTIGVTRIEEYQLPSVIGIQVITTPSTDPFGGFTTIPTINGYQYNYAVLLGSTAISRGGGAGGVRGGYIRGISYMINVPLSPSTKPYTMTYAYAMVLENGTHNSNEQPLFKATLSTNDSIISCASPSYLLPTNNSASTNGTGAQLDSAAAFAEGFTPSNIPTPNPSANNTTPYDVWTKGWREVTFDLSAYRGRTVSLTFESDNCVPGGHFAYAYIALRDQCSGLQISGAPQACTNTNLSYSVPALAEASYEWSIPSDWLLDSGSNTNIISVTPGAQNGFIIVHEQNSCADLRDTLKVTTLPPTIPGAVINDTTMCAGINSKNLLLTTYRGSVLSWVSSTDGTNWRQVPDNTPSYTARNLTNTTIYKAVVQNGASCRVDTSAGATIFIDQPSEGGSLSPVQSNFCAGQIVGALLQVAGNNGSIVNWQSSPDGIVWSNINPTNNDSIYQVTGLTSSMQYRLIAKNGVCKPDTSSVAAVRLFSTPFPQAFTEPADTTICFGGTAHLNAIINIGTGYTWVSTFGINNKGNGIINGTPYSMQVTSSPLISSDYILNISNAGCPNELSDTFHVKVLDPIIVNAGRDTSVVINQPLQLNASSNDPLEDTYTWTPPTGLNNPNIPDPIAILNESIDSIRYVVKATSQTGCFGTATIGVKVFKTLPDIFVPNAFTPGRTVNSIFRPIPVGITSLLYFRVYNRWGQLMYSTSRIGDGWDGTIAGKQQGTQTFVWMVAGTTYTGKTVFKKGTVTLIR